MVVGFTITELRGYKQEAIDYINKVCILESPDVAENIVDAGVGVNIFSTKIDIAELEAQPFKSKPIKTQDGKYLLVSIVEFNLELIYNNGILRLIPTEFVYIEPDELIQFKEYREQGLVRTIPNVDDDGEVWILAKGEWDDHGVWVDSNLWRDSHE